VEAARSLAAGARAIGAAEPGAPRATPRSFEGIVPKATDWRTLGTAAEESPRLEESAAE
jgi:phthalate 4,5-dioxygenase oxygenase subunit